MEPGCIDAALNFAMISSAGAGLLLVLLNALAYGATEGKEGPHVKQMAACLVATIVFVLSGIAKLFRWVF